jgi:uncharacterized protein (DUF2267 family)
MNFDAFMGELQHRLGTPGTGETVRATRATLSTLGSRIPEGAAEDLAASLPMEVGWLLTGAVKEHGQRFDWHEFVSRAADIEAQNPEDSAYHAQVVMDFVASLVPESDIQDLRGMLPEAESTENWQKLFEVVDAGGWTEHETNTL